jgi:hypothetical protein
MIVLCSLRLDFANLEDLITRSCVLIEIPLRGNQLKIDQLKQKFDLWNANWFDYVKKTIVQIEPLIDLTTISIIEINMHI